MSIRTAVYKPTDLKINSRGLQMVILLTIACFISILYYILMSRISFANLLFHLANYLYLCEMCLVVAFCCINIELKSKIIRSSLIIICIASILLGINMMQYMNGYGYELDTDNFYLSLLLQYNIFRLIFYIGIVLLLLSLTKVIILSGWQKIFRIAGIIWILLYLSWIFFFRFPNDALMTFSSEPVGILGSYAQACYKIYQPFTWLLDNHLNLNIIGITNDVILSLISLSFIRTKIFSDVLD